MNPISETDPEGDDPRLLDAVREYMDALESGRHPNRREFVNRHPEIATELSACLDGLAFVHSTAGLMAASTDTSGRPAELDPATAQPIGDFRLVREIGRGGMGVVYEAMQLSLGRRVALKILPFAAALDSRHLERFRNEAQAAARLHHTNIVPVYAVGCDRSVHFYAMQLIEGRSLAEVIGELRQLASRPGTIHASEPTDVPRLAKIPANSASGIHGSSAFAACSVESLSTLRTARGSAYSRSVASLGLQVAEALEYAHRAGVVHRDIKPANLLLDGQGCLWVTDFGLAQFYAESELTRSGDLVGTLRYMSPEQASGRAVVLDQRTDIYSLGVTLYELLTLERAHNGSTCEALLQQLAHDEPQPARAIDRTIPRELETVLSKAMAKDPADRYSSARSLADDLRRFLQDEPIHAKPPSAWDQALKWTRRHKSLTRSALVVLVLAAIGLGISTARITREQAKTAAAYQNERNKAIEADLQRARAERASRQARGALDFFSRLAAEEMDKPEFSEVRREMLEESLSYYQSFLEDAGDDPSVSAELDAARTRVATLLTYFSALDASLRASSRVRLLSEDSVQKDLKLTAAQTTAALEFSTDYAPRPGENLSDLRQMTTLQKGSRFAARAAEIDAAMIRILGAERAERLRQIQRQVRGPMSFSDPDLVERLAPTRAERARIRSLQLQFRNARFGPRGEDGPPGRGRRRGNDGPPEDGRPPGEDGPPPPRESMPFDEENVGGRATMANIMAVLTPTQMAIWKSMTGEPFTGKITTGGPGRGRGDGPDHGQGGRPGIEQGFGPPRRGP